MATLDGDVPAHEDPGRRDGDRLQAEFARVEARLIAEFGGNPAADAVVHQHLAAVRELFAVARIRHYLPILVERAVRARLAPP